ncbi:MAG: galactosyltransferase-related protein [Janthinobacterium lividum]
MKTNRSGESACGQETRTDVVVPVDLGRRPLDLLFRVRALCEQTRMQPVSLVIGHNDRRSPYDRMLKALCRRYDVRLVSRFFYRDNVNNARLRNEAMSAVTAPLTLLLDADLLLPGDTVARVAASVATGDFPFRILPCLYLSRRGSKDLGRGDISPQGMLDAYFRFRRAPFLHLALPSSVALFRTEDFDRCGGFDTAFEGHGYEDFDFLLRLAWLHGLVPRTRDLLIDRPTRAPLLSLGFRSHLARLTLPGMLRHEFAFHLWHPAAKDDYYMARGENAQRLTRKIEAELAMPCASGSAAEPAIDMPLLRFWLDLCEHHGANPRDYLILFDNRPGHSDRFDTVGRRLRFLLGNH